MTALSVNLNKLALLRNSRGRNYPDLPEFARRFISLGVHGITVHPRPDERHVTRRDVHELAELLQDHAHVEFNVEGYPSPAFLQLVKETAPTQCTLVPDADAQLTSDHGWDCRHHQAFLCDVVGTLREQGMRVALFLDADLQQVEAAASTRADRIELYTEGYAKAFAQGDVSEALQHYRETAMLAQSLGLGTNAGHDLDLDNLPTFLAIPGILEVSIGHALTIECIEQGMTSVISRYLAICKAGA